MSIGIKQKRVGIDKAIAASNWSFFKRILLIVFFSSVLVSNNMYSQNREIDTYYCLTSCSNPSFEIPFLYSNVAESESDSYAETGFQFEFMNSFSVASNCACFCLTYCGYPQDDIPNYDYVAVGFQEITITSPVLASPITDIDLTSGCIDLSAPGVYTVTYTTFYSDGSIAGVETSTITVTGGATPPLSIASSNVFCEDDPFDDIISSIANLEYYEDAEILIAGSIGGWNELELFIADGFLCAGEYDIMVSGVDACGVYSTATSSFTITPPAVGLKPLVYNCNTVQFNPLYDCFSDIISFEWDFGDLTTTTLAYPIDHVYAPGTYTVTLTITDRCGVEYTESQTITISDVLSTTITGPINVNNPCASMTLFYSFSNNALMDSYYLTTTGPGTAAFSSSVSGIIIVTILDYSDDVTVTLHYTDKNGCPGEETFIIKSCCQGDIPLIGDPIVCVNTTNTYTLDIGSPTMITSINISPPGIGIATPTTSNSFDVTFTSSGTATITVNYTYNHGLCQGVSTIEVTVVKSPPVTLLPFPDLCITDSPIDLTDYIDMGGGLIAGTGAFSGVGVTGSTFDPSAAGTGSWTITYTFMPDFGICPPIVLTQDILVVDGLWNITTENTIKNDEGNDIITDNEGNVYVTGTFEVTTTFPGFVDVTIPNSPLSTSVPEFGSAYIAKYDPCGELLWVNFDSHDVPSLFSNSHGSAITIDETNDLIYIGGYVKGAIQFQDVASSISGGVAIPAVASSVITPASSKGTYYIARFNTNDGSFDAIKVFTLISPADKNYELTGLDIQMLPSVGPGPGAIFNSQIYYSGYYSEEGIHDVSLVGRVKSTTAGFTMTGAWRKSAIDSDVSHAWDVAVDGTTNRVYITGDFNGSLTFEGGAPTAGTFALKDAYYAKFNSNTGVALDLKLCGAGTGEIGVGTGIDIDASGKLYLTGHVSNNVLPLFGITGAMFPGGATMEQRGYVLKINPSLPATSSYIWHRRIQDAIGGDAEPSDIFVKAGAVYVTGTFISGLIVPPLPYPGPSTALKKVFVCEYGAPLGGFHWVNGTTTSISTSQHLSARVTSSDTYVYSTGTYAGELDYIATASSTLPYSGPLYSTFHTQFNTYIVRNEIGGGLFKSAEQEAETSSEEFGLVSGLSIYPNPTTGTIYLENIYEGASVEIYSMDGSLVYSEVAVTDGVLTLGLDHLTNGIYLLQVKNLDGSILTGKVIKQ